MKKIRLLLVLAAIFVLSGLLCFLYEKKGGPGDFASASPAEYTPQDVVFFACLTNINEISARFKESALGRFLAKDTMHAIMDSLEAPPERKADYDEVYDAVARLVSNPVFQQVFGDDITFAFLKPDAEQFKNDPEKGVKRSLVIYATTRSMPMLKLAGLVSGEVKIEKERIDGVELSHFLMTNSEDSCYAYSANGILILALEKEPVLAALKAKSGGATLAASPAYQDGEKFWRSLAVQTSYWHEYTDVAGLLELMRLMAAQDESEGGEASGVQDARQEKIRQYFSGWKAGYSTGGKSERGLESKALLTFAYEALQKEVKMLVDEAAAGNGAPLSLFGENTLFFSWENTWRPEDFFQMFTAEMKTPKLDEIRQGVQKALAMSLDDVLASFGPGHGLVLNDIQTKGLFPVPDLALYAEVRNRGGMEKLAAAANKKISAQGVESEIKRIETTNTQFYAWPVMPEAGFVPFLGINDQFVFLGTAESTPQHYFSRQDLRPLAETTHKSLAQETSQMLARANTAIYAVRLGKLGDKAPQLLKFLNSATDNHYERLGQEIVKLLQANELVVIGCGITAKKDAFEGNLLWTAAADAPAAAPPTTQAQ